MGYGVLPIHPFDILREHVFQITLTRILSSAGCVFHAYRQEMKESLDERLLLGTQPDLEYLGVPHTRPLTVFGPS
jgi:hypothetical protein